MWMGREVQKGGLKATTLDLALLTVPDLYQTRGRAIAKPTASAAVNLPPSNFPYITARRQRASAYHLASNWLCAAEVRGICAARGERSDQVLNRSPCD